MMGTSSAESRRWPQASINIGEWVLSHYQDSEVVPGVMSRLYHTYGYLLEDYQKGYFYCQQMADRWPNGLYASEAQYWAAKFFRYTIVPPNEMVALDSEYEAILEAYRKVLERYPGTEAAASALLALGGICMYKWGRWWRRAAEHFE